MKQDSVNPFFEHDARGRRRLSPVGRLMIPTVGLVLVGALLVTSQWIGGSSLRGVITVPGNAAPDAELTKPPYLTVANTTQPNIPVAPADAYKAATADYLDAWNAVSFTTNFPASDAEARSLLATYYERGGPAYEQAANLILDYQRRGWYIRRMLAPNSPFSISKTGVGSGADIIQFAVAFPSGVIQQEQVTIANGEVATTNPSNSIAIAVEMHYDGQSGQWKVYQETIQTNAKP